MNRTEYMHNWYLNNMERQKLRSSLYKKNLKADPVAWKEHCFQKQLRYYKRNPDNLVKKAIAFWQLVKRNPKALSKYLEIQAKYLQEEK